MTYEATYPFPQDLHENREIERGAFATIREFSSNPDVIVKELPPQIDIDSGHVLTGDAGFKKFREVVAKYDSLIKYSKTDIAKYIPKSMLVFGSNDQEKDKGFIVAEKVTGKDIGKIDTISTDNIIELESLIITSLDLFEESSNSLRYFPDLTRPTSSSYELLNIMVGTTKNNPKEQIYLIDTYPLIYAGNSKSSEFDHLKRALENFSRKFGVEFSPELRQRLIAYGKTAFEPYMHKAYTEVLYEQV